MVRPLRHTPVAEEAILVGIRHGMAKTKAAQAAGFNHNTVWEWMTKSPAFAAKVHQAEAECQSKMLAVVIGAAEKMLPNTWQAAAWLLERRWPDEFGQKTRLDVNIDLQAEIRELALAAGLDPADLVAQAEGIIATHAVTKRDLTAET